MTTKKINTPPAQHHYFRTIVASLFGTIALSLVLMSLLTVWVERTLTDTPTFVSTVAPLATRPAIQDFVVAKAIDQLLKNAPTDDLANTLLPPSKTNGKTPDQLAAAVRPVVEGSLRQIVTSPGFADLWKTTLQSAHSQFIAQLKADSPEITLDLSPAISGVVAQLKQTKLAPISDKIEIKPEMGKFNLKGGSIEQAHKYYGFLQQGMVGLLVLTGIMILLSVGISVHHTKTLRRIAVGTGLIALVLAGILQAPSLVKFDMGDPVAQAAGVAIAATLFHNLQVACLILGTAAIALAIGSKLLPGPGRK